VNFRGLACPVAAGDVSLDFDVSISQYVPSSLAVLEMDITAEGSSGKLLCATINTSPALATPTDDAWEAFKLQFPKSYNSESEEAQHKATFAENFARIAEHNNAGKKFSLGVNQFADLTEAEWTATYKGAKRPEGKEEIPNLGLVGEEVELADSVDWVSRGAVTPIKDQGQCGSCWSFSATGATEGTYQIASGNLVSLAEQQIVDCDTTDGNEGCNGGWPYAAVTYLSRYGACQESSYPYRATDGSCAISSCTMALQPGVVSGYNNVAQTENGLMSALMSSPVSVTINAEGYAFQLYSQGVMTTACSGYTDHAVLAVGYATDTDGTPYWRVKNSWGTTWGMAGYFNMERGNGAQGSLCILQDAPVVPQISASISV